MLRSEKITNFGYQTIKLITMRTLSHFGIPSAEKMEGMAYLEDLKVHITDHAASPNKLEFLYFEPDSPMHKLIQTRAHVAYNVEDINAALEGTKVLLGRKPGVTGLKDGAYRMVKTGAAMGVGTAVAGAAGFWAAIPVTMGVRALFDRYRSKALTGLRVQGRIGRLKELNTFLRKEDAIEVEAPVYTDAVEAVAAIE